MLDSIGVTVIGAGMSAFSHEFKHGIMGSFEVCRVLLAMDGPRVGFGQNDAFMYQARAFLDEVTGLDPASSLHRNASFDDGVHNLEILTAATESATNNGHQVSVAQKEMAL